jgi:ribosomal protein L29
MGGFGTTRSPQADRATDRKVQELERELAELKKELAEMRREMRRRNTDRPRDGGDQ